MKKKIALVQSIVFSTLLPLIIFSSGTRWTLQLAAIVALSLKVHPLKSHAGLDHTTTC